MGDLLPDPERAEEAERASDEVGFSSARDTIVSGETKLVENRRSANRQFWVGEAAIKTEQQDFQIKEHPDDEDSIQLATGRINDFSLKAGRLKVRNLQASGDQAFETLFAQYLHETKDFDSLSVAPPGLANLAADPDFDRRLKGTTRTLAFGIAG